MLDLATEMEDSRIFEIILNPVTFSFALRSLSFNNAMDFIEDNIISNPIISHALKLTLLDSTYMLPYAFIGAILHLCSNDSFTDDEVLNMKESEYIEVEKLYNKMTSFDLL